LEGFLHKSTEHPTPRNKKGQTPLPLRASQETQYHKPTPKEKMSKHKASSSSLSSSAAPLVVPTNVLKRIRFRTVAPTDILQCLEIERASYVSNEAASKNTLQYRQHHAAPYFRCAVLREEEEDCTEVNGSGTGGTGTGTGTGGTTGEYVCEEDNQEAETIVGFICSTRCHEWTEETLSTHVATGSVLAIHSIVVRPEYRRQGLASAMLRDYVATIDELNRLQIKQFQADAQKKQLSQQQQNSSTTTSRHHPQASTSSFVTTGSAPAMMHSTMSTVEGDAALLGAVPKKPTRHHASASMSSFPFSATTTATTMMAGSSAPTTAPIITKLVLLSKVDLLSFYVDCGFSAMRPTAGRHLGTKGWYDLELLLEPPTIEEDDNHKCNDEGDELLLPIPTHDDDPTDNDDDDMGWESDWQPDLPFSPTVVATTSSKTAGGLDTGGRGIPCFMVDSFAIVATTPGTGNPAAVVLLPTLPANELPPALETWCQVIAAEFNLAETAFCWPRSTTTKLSREESSPPSTTTITTTSSSGGGGELHWNIRYFTPKVEVPLCGHATLASAAVLYQTIPYAKLTDKRIVFHAKEDQLVMQYARPLLLLPLGGTTTSYNAYSTSISNSISGEDDVRTTTRQQPPHDGGDEKEEPSHKSRSASPIPPPSGKPRLGVTVPPLPNNNNRPRTLTADLLTPLALKKSASGDGVIGSSRGGGGAGEPRQAPATLANPRGTHARAVSLMSPSISLDVASMSNSNNIISSSAATAAAIGGGENRNRVHSRSSHVSSSSLAFTASFESGTSGAGGGGSAKPDKTHSVLTTKISMEFPAKPATEITSREELSAVHKMLESTFSCTLDTLYVGISDIGDVLVELTPKSFHEIGYECLNFKALLEWDGYYRGVIICCTCPDSKLQQQIIQSRVPPARSNSIGSNKSDSVLLSSVAAADGASLSTATTNANPSTTDSKTSNNTDGNNATNSTSYVNGSSIVVKPPPVASPDFLSRFFGPKAGINEDPVTGSAHCVLGPYFAKKLNKGKMVGKQMSERGGIVECEVTADNKVILTGSAVITMSGTLWL
jgi:predicted PhzF superfamily epimerase YddE/YHI9/ribosomal protein S18 acetylase RimI-like enzyme